MRLLLDTHVVPWDLLDSRRVSPSADEALERATELLFSVVSFAEIGVKVSTGKLTAPADLHDRVLQSGLKILGLDVGHGLALADLPMHHRDPFDRLLVAQARSEQLTIITADRRMARYDVRFVYAG